MQYSTSLNNFLSRVVNHCLQLIEEPTELKFAIKQGGWIEQTNFRKVHYTAKLTKFLLSKALTTFNKLECTKASLYGGYLITVIATQSKKELSWIKPR